MTWLHGTLSLLLLAGACVLVSIAAELRRSVRRTQLKFALYAARDRLYLAAAKGILSVRTPLFRLLRDGIAGSIRYAERFGPEELELLTGASTPATGGTTSQLVDAMMNLSDEAREETIAIAMTMLDSSLKLMRLNSRLVRRTRLGSLLEPKSGPAAVELRQVRVVESGLLNLRELHQHSAACQA